MSDETNEIFYSPQMNMLAVLGFIKEVSQKREDVREAIRLCRCAEYKLKKERDETWRALGECKVEDKKQQIRAHYKSYKRLLKHSRLLQDKSLRAFESCLY
jgi:hypothetical protein